MDVVLLAITVVSLIVAAIMSGVAWRLGRDHRAHAAARVAALSAAAMEVDPTVRPSSTPLVEANSEPVAVGESRSPAPWTPVRVSSFSTGPRTAAGAAARPHVVDDLPLAHAIGEGFLGSAVSSSHGAGRQRPLAMAALVLVAVAIGAGSWLFFGGSPSRSHAASAPSDTAPLELVSLRHERQGGRLSVTGLIRNPTAGTAIDALSAIVFLFDQQGAFITSARAGVDFQKLAPGEESPFVIALDAPASVARYRVSFRNDAGVVPHIDRRGEAPLAAQTANPTSTAR